MLLILKTSLNRSYYEPLPSRRIPLELKICSDPLNHPTTFCRSTNSFVKLLGRRTTGQLPLLFSLLRRHLQATKGSNALRITLQMFLYIVTLSDLIFPSSHFSAEVFYRRPKLSHQTIQVLVRIEREDNR